MKDLLPLFGDLNFLSTRSARNLLVLRVDGYTVSHSLPLEMFLLMLVTTAPLALLIRVVLSTLSGCQRYLWSP